MEHEVGKYLLEKRNCTGPSFCPFPDDLRDGGNRKWRVAARGGYREEEKKKGGMMS